MSRINQILIGLALTILTISLTAAYYWPEKNLEVLAEDKKIEIKIEPKEITQIQDLVVTVLNGSRKDGMAGKTQKFLEKQDIFVTRVGNAPTKDYAFSEILYHPESSQASSELAQLLKITIRTPTSSFESKLFVTVVIGADFLEPIIEENPE